MQTCTISLKGSSKVPEKVQKKASDNQRRNGEWYNGKDSLPKRGSIDETHVGKDEPEGSGKETDSPPDRKKMMRIVPKTQSKHPLQNPGRNKLQGRKEESGKKDKKEKREALHH
jgi:hypothetical protein